MKKLLGLMVMALLCSVAFGTVTTKPMDWSDLAAVAALADSGDTATTYAISWSEAPNISLAWQAYGDSGATYDVAVQCADLWGHFDPTAWTVVSCTVSVADSTRATARRYVRQFSRPVSEYGRALFFNASDTVTIDSTAFVQDER